MVNLLRRRVSAGMLALFVAFVALTGCSDDEGESASTTAEPSTTQETDAEETTTTKEAAETSQTTGETDETEIPPWELTAVPYRDRVGETVEIECPPDGEPTTIWGTGTYTDDSSICTAAVHAGLITLEDGGDVSIEVTEGEESYEGSEANGITSTDYGAWDGSFVFTDEP